MYSNICTKCGQNFDTKNPKRVICPSCLYPESNTAARPQQRPQQRPGGYQQRQGGGGQRPGGYRHGGGGGRPGGFQQRRGPGGPPQRRGPGGPPPRGGGRFQRGGPPRRGGPKKLLVSKEQLAQIEEMYKKALPLPNPDIHEVIGKEIDLAPSKVFFGINLIREKMRLPKLEYPKRRLALTPEQLSAIETLYEGFLPLPPVGVHKIIAKQLKIEEWRVHVGIGLIRKNRNLPRWNEDRTDIPEEMKQPKGKKPAPGSEAGDKKPEKAAKPEKAEKEDSKEDSAEPKAKKPARQPEPVQDEEVETGEPEADEAEAQEEEEEEKPVRRKKA